MCIQGSTRWAKCAAKVPSDPDINKFAGGTWKCNLFVSDITVSTRAEQSKQYGLENKFLYFVKPTEYWALISVNVRYRLFIWHRS